MADIGQAPPPAPLHPDDEKAPPRARSRSRSPRRRSRSRSRSRSPKRHGGGGDGKRLRGTASRWNERGFGFIKPENPDDPDVFCHFSAIQDGNCLREGDEVEYEKTFDESKGKDRAENVTGGRNEERRPRRSAGECYSFRDGNCSRGDSCRFSHGSAGGGGGGGYGGGGGDRYSGGDRYGGGGGGDRYGSSDRYGSGDRYGGGRDRYDDRRDDRRGGDRGYDRGGAYSGGGAGGGGGYDRGYDRY